MKRVILSLFAALLVTAVLQAQSKMNTVKTDLFSPILRTYVFKYERALNADMSFQLGFFYSARYYKFTIEDETVSGEGTLTNFSFALNLGKQVVLKDLIVIDAWVGPSYNFRSFEEDVPDIETGNIPDANGFGLRVGLAIGFVF